MSHIAAGLSSNESEDEPFIRRELLGLVLAHTRVATLGNLAVATAAVVVLAFRQPTPALAVWFGALSLITLGRVLLRRRVSSHLPQLDFDGIQRVENALTVLIVLSGLAWGFLPWIGYTGEDAFTDFFTAAMLVGMTGGGTPSLSAMPRTLKLYLCATLVPFIVRAAMIGGTVSVAGGITILFCLIVLWAFGRSNHDSLRRTLRLTSENTRLARALREQRDAVQAAMQAKDLFQAGVTHDLRQPVHALALHLRWLRSARAEAEPGEATATAWNAVDSALALIDGQLTRLLDLSRLESGEVRPVLEDVPLEPILRACEMRLAPRAAAKGLELRFRTTRAVVRADPHMLQSVLDNFVSNAIRYTSRGGVLVGARTRTGHVEIQVYDTGCGIPPALIPELFIAYRRFSDSDRKGDAGHGLGLALASKQAQLQGHRLAVRSSPGRGSMFSVTMPTSASPSPVV